MVQLNRFEVKFMDGDFVASKLHDRCQFGHELDMSPYICEDCEDITNYTLSGVVIHSGKTMNAGHYYSLVKRGNDWWRYSLFVPHPVMAEVGVTTLVYHKFQTLAKL